MKRARIDLRPYKRGSQTNRCARNEEYTDDHCAPTRLPSRLVRVEPKNGVWPPGGTLVPGHAQLVGAGDKQEHTRDASEDALDRLRHEHGHDENGHGGANVDPEAPQPHR